MKNDGSSKYTSADCIAALEAYRSERREIPTRSGYMTWCVGKDLPSTGVLLRILAPDDRSWNSVLAHLGVTPEEVSTQRSQKHSTFSIEECRSALQKCCAKLSATPQQIQYEKWRRKHASAPSALTIVRLLDPEFPRKQRWHVAVKDLGFDVSLIPERKITRPGVPHTLEEIVSVVRRCASELQEVPSTYAYDQWRKEQNALGDFVPTQTTVRRRLSRANRWSEALEVARLDSSRISELSRARRTNLLQERAIESLTEFAEHFSGLAPLSLYLRWSMLDVSRASVGSILFHLTRGSRKWDDALETAGVSSLERIDAETALARNGELPTLATQEECVSLVRQYYLECAQRPTITKFRQWLSSHDIPVSENEIIYNLSPQRWDWSIAIDAAFASMEKATCL